MISTGLPKTVPLASSTAMRAATTEPLAAQIGIEAGLVVEHANSDDIVGNLRVGNWRSKTRHSKNRIKDNYRSHTVLSACV